MSMLHPYQDRKKLKWMGFFLSEHTSNLDAIEEEERNVTAPKPEMTPQEIHEILTEAKVKNKAIEVQVSELVDDNYQPDIIGHIQGHDETGVYIGDELVEYESIRNINFHDSPKWFDVQ